MSTAQYPEEAEFFGDVNITTSQLTFKLTIPNISFSATSNFPNNYDRAEDGNFPGVLYYKEKTALQGSHSGDLWKEGNTLHVKVYDGDDDPINLGEFVIQNFPFEVPQDAKGFIQFLPL